MADENDPDRPEDEPPSPPSAQAVPGAAGGATPSSVAEGQGEAEREAKPVALSQPTERAAEEDATEQALPSQTPAEAPWPSTQAAETATEVASDLSRIPEAEAVLFDATQESEGEFAPEAPAFDPAPALPEPGSAEAQAALWSPPSESVKPETPDAALFETPLEPAAEAIDVGIEAPAAAVAAAIEPPVDADDARAPAGAAPKDADLPPNYFRAAGDPDEPEPELDLSWRGRLRARAEALMGRARALFEPRWMALTGAAHALRGEAGRRVGAIKHPRNVREAAVWSGWIAAISVSVLVGFYFLVIWGMPSTDDLWEARNGQSITFLDRSGHVILREGAQNAPPVDLESLPSYVGQAFIAIEDRRFYQHFGVDFGGMMRAGAENIRAGHVVQGGSTITQQLAKNLFLTNERSWRRKAQEIAMAIWLETKFTKEEILALYLSRVYFGAGAYGVEAAAERYFDRPARELTLLQAALIAGLVKAPSRLNPARQDIAAARARAEVVLNEMVAMGFIGEAELSASLGEEIVISRRNPAGVLGYYRDWIDPLLNQIIGTQRDDFIVETTLDIAAQRAGAEAVEAVLAAQGEARRVGQAALIAYDDLGGVRAMVGGRDYDQSQFNRATQARRQPGSSFKYFIYLAAMENGLTPWSIREDTRFRPGEFGEWTPGNYEDEYHGPSELARAYALSYNMVAIRVAHEVGGQTVIDVARRLGVTSKLEPYDLLALGAQEMTLAEMTAAYGAMAAEGYLIEPHGVTRIRRGNDDETMWSWRQSAPRRVIEELPLRYMNYLMHRVVEAGTGTPARISGRQIGGKTGTGNDYRDAWFVGYTPGFVAGVWAGNDNFTETARVTGGSLPAEIWARFMGVALRNVPVRAMEMPRPEDYAPGARAPRAQSYTVVGAPLGAVLGAPTAAPPDDQDRSLDFGPEG